MARRKADDGINRAALEAKRVEYADRLASVRQDLERLSRLAMQLQGAIGGLDELLAPDIEDVLPEGAEIVPDDEGT